MESRSIEERVDLLEQRMDRILGVLETLAEAIKILTARVDRAVTIDELRAAAEDTQKS